VNNRRNAILGLGRSRNSAYAFAQSVLSVLSFLKVFALFAPLADRTMRTESAISSACSAAFGGTRWRYATAVWALAVVSVFGWITRYEFSTYANERLDVASQWPIDSRLELSGDKPLLLLFMHPHCPCTRATLRELQRVLDAPAATGQERPKVIVSVSMPAAADDAWANSDTTRQVLSLPNATLFLDRGGVEANRFGAVSSGMVMLYSSTGRQLYAGGITVSRGHEGDNLGATHLLELVRNPNAQAAAGLPVFGCQLCLPANDPNLTL
jgi:hypothetical protein